MKIRKRILSLSVAALGLWAAGCDSQKEALVPEQTKAVGDGAGDPLQQVTAAAKESGAKIASNVVAQATEVAAPASDKAQALIDSANSLVGEGEFQDALAKLNEIDGEKLSLDQRSLVDGLKVQIGKALAATSKAPADASSAVGGLLKK